MKKTVLILLDTLYSAGAENIAVRLAVGVHHSPNYRPILFATRDGGDLEEALRKEEVGYTLLGRRHTYEVHKFLPVKRVIREDNVSLIHAHKTGSNFWGSIIGRLSGVPVIAHAHGKVHTRRSALVNRLIAGLSYRMIAVSDHQRRSLIDEDGISPSKIVTIYNGIDHDQFRTEPAPDVRRRLGLEPGSYVIGICAALRPEKRHETFLLAAKDVTRQKKNARFLIIGDGARRGMLTQLAAELGISGQCIFTGHVKNVADVLSVLDVGVLSSDREGMPVTLLQYMASAKPVVATRVGGIPEAVEDGASGFLVPAGDHEALASRLVQLGKNGALRSSMGQKGLAIVRDKFSEKLMLSRVMELYAEALAGHESASKAG